MEIRYSSSVVDGTFKHKFSTIKNYTWAKVWSTHTHTHAFRDTWYNSLAVTYTEIKKKKNLSKGYYRTLKTGEDFHPVCGHCPLFLLLSFKLFCPAMPAESWAWQPWGGKVEKSPLLNTLYASLFSVHLPEKSGIRAWHCSGFAINLTW